MIVTDDVQRVDCADHAEQHVDEARDQAHQGRAPGVGVGAGRRHDGAVFYPGGHGRCRLRRAGVAGLRACRLDGLDD